MPETNKISPYPHYVISVCGTRWNSDLGQEEQEPLWETTMQSLVDAPVMLMADGSKIRMVREEDMGQLLDRKLRETHKEVVEEEDQLTQLQMFTDDLTKAIMLADNIADRIIEGLLEMDEEVSDE